MKIKGKGKRDTDKYATIYVLNMRRKEHDEKIIKHKIKYKRYRQLSAHCERKERERKIIKLVNLVLFTKFDRA